MNITAIYQAQLADAAGTARQTFELPVGTTVLDLAHQAARHHGEPFAAMLLRPDRSPHPWLLIAINDRALPRVPAGGTWPQLAHNDSVSFLSPISGG